MQHGVQQSEKLGSMSLFQRSEMHGISKSVGPGRKLGEVAADRWVVGILREPVRFIDNNESYRDGRCAGDMHILTFKRQLQVCVWAWGLALGTSPVAGTNISGRIKDQK